MNRIYKIQKVMLVKIKECEAIPITREKSLDWERIHMVGCAKIGLSLAGRRGVDPDLAAMACAVHDFGRIITGINEGHAEAGYGPVQEFLAKLGFVTEDEIRQIAIAVKNHSRKGEIGSPLEELVKDADLIDFRQYGFDFEREDQRLRYERIAEDIG
ncbi:MAG: metal-dependent phosphohydrolase [Treponema sp. GWB1_62_6]|nr:MAG: metal-dependent phosphohydrolase [Treponema sp. GWA1_62_8]OHE66123.1 MAG: metal-dependent phosphohydrolase [Treponema sp. GWB1_62_6]OHE68991.1 MAG: metal-dependent phosphohydrolase [Treponema sp. GWC1_61_84]OHE69952.1 MAG: metal-dependent phosphohydrolase [Treponema sp. RIFOXYC1_FULL_61_9]HCM28518.1 metal-dependent phosphohydrolase [Treponema sp.]